MSYHVRTSVFEGPLDLLLQLITRHQVDVTSVSLADLVTEYLAHLDEMRTLDLDVTSEFLLIAATLIQLKIRQLLPTDSELDLDEELELMEERDRLLS
ncbi:MAG: segregation/condensation protein A, partial [Acidimicrobiia bacterium]